MKKNEIMNKMSRSFNKVSFQIKKHSPEILVVAGVTGTVVSAVMACKATTKVSQILEESKKDIDSIHAATENEELTDVYSAEDSKKDLMIVYAQTGVKLAKLYAPAVILGGLSVTSILASNNILRKRNVALAAAYATVDKGFKEYRSRVVDRFGKDVDYELKCDIKAKEIEETIVDDKGKEKKVKKTVNVANSNTESDYARYFTSHNPYWEASPEYNELFLRARESYATDMLRAQGHLTLNEVYKMLGFEETKAGMVVGWVYDAENPVGDNFVDLSIRKVYLPKENSDDLELAYALDFNVDGNIYDMM